MIDSKEKIKHVVLTAPNPEGQDYIMNLLLKLKIF